MSQDDLDRFARDYPDQFKVYYVLNEVSFLFSVSFKNMKLLE